LLYGNIPDIAFVVPGKMYRCRKSVDDLVVPLIEMVILQSPGGSPVTVNLPVAIALGKKREIYFVVPQAHEALVKPRASREPLP